MKDTVIYEGTHQILHHAHPLAAQLCHQAIDVHKVVIPDVLDEVVQGDKHARPAHSSAAGRRDNNTQSDTNTAVTKAQ